MKKIGKIYIGGTLTHADNDIKNVYEKLGETCKSLGYEAYVPHLEGTDPVANPEVTPYDVWVKDHKEVSSADLLISYVGQPSLGTGAELEIARITMSDILLWWFKGEKVSRMTKGNPAVVKQIEIDNLEGLIKQIKKYLNGN